MKRKRLFPQFVLCFLRPAALVAAAFSLAACGVLEARIEFTPAAPQTSPTGIANLLPTPAASSRPATVQPTNTPLPSSTLYPPTTTPIPQPTQPVGERLVMQPGSTHVQAEGQVSAGGHSDYRVTAQAGQFMMAMLTSANQELSLQIQSPDGSVLATTGQAQTYWQGSLPQNGDYLISIISPGTSGAFTLSIDIPVRVKFAPGAVSASLKGVVSSRGVNKYLLRALKGQTMTVTITSPQNDIFLTIYGLEDGQPYVRSALGLTHASLELPATQDYVLEADSTSDSTETYTIDFVVR